MLHMDNSSNSRVSYEQSNQIIGRGRWSQVPFVKCSELGESARFICAWKYGIWAMLILEQLFLTVKNLAVYKPGHLTPKFKAN